MSSKFLLAAAALLLACAGRPVVCVPASAAPMGAALTGSGASFRIWAPSAHAVSVQGSWSAKPSALSSECGSEVFSTLVSGPRAGDTYLFLVDGAAVIDPRARQLAAPAGPGVLVDPAAFAWKTAAFTPPALRKAIVYELHVGAAGGFAGVIAQLDRLAALGVNAVELMPVSQFRRDVDWGYGPEAPFAIEAGYGGADGLRALVDAAHARGIAVIADIVHNHYASDSILPADYFYPAALATPWGPRPDFAQPMPRAFVRDAALQWQDEYRLDGFRWDAVGEIRDYDDKSQANSDGASLLRETIAALHGRPSLQIAEDWAADSAQVTDPAALGFDARWDGFFHDVDAAAAAATDDAIDLGSVARAVAGGPRRVVYTESHDEVGHPSDGKRRIPTRVDPANPESLQARKRSTLAAALALTSPGTPMIFMGQEMLETADFAFPSPAAQDWSRAARFAGIVQLYTDLFHLRRGEPALADDRVQVFHQNDGAKVLAYLRGGSMVVVANLAHRSFASYDLGFPAGGAWHVRFTSDSTQYASDFTGQPSADVTATAVARDGFAYSGSLPLGEASVVVLSQ